jgi:lipoprotein-releasing system permease protein
LAWKQLFPSQRKISFFSMLAIIGVALGVNVMIVVIAFMQGFQQKFRKDIINAQGHARAISLRSSSDWRQLPPRILEQPAIEAVTPFLQGQLLIQSGTYKSIPFALGLRPEDGDGVLPLGDFLDRGMLRLQAHDGEDVTPLPTVDTLDDGSVFVSSQVASRLGVRPPAVVRLYEGNATRTNTGEKGDLRVLRLDPYVESGEWEIQADENGSILVSESISG